jgi:general secretion pathway protein J
MTRTRRDSPGFTLIELLVALAIFAILSLISFRTLSSIFQTREHLQVETARLRDAALLFARLDSDMTGLLDRKIRNADGLEEASFRLVSRPQSTEDPVLAFTRVGFADAGGGSTAPQRVGYRLKDNKLELLLWPALDLAPRTLPQAYAALGNVREATWRALDRGGNRVPDWPVPSSSAGSGGPYPAAIELKLVLITGEEFTRLYAIRHD